MTRRLRAIRAAAIGVALLAPLALAPLALAPVALAEDGAPPPPPSPIPAPGANPETPVAEKFTVEQLKELVGPVALYPDVVLSSLLPATTAPLDVIAAARYVEAQGGKVTAVPAGTTWDKSVQAMLQYPDALKWMADNPEWLKQIGEAVATQQAEVLGAVQTFRSDAQKAGNLRSDDHMAVRTEPAPAGAPVERVIVIEPATPTTVYVPSYDPYAVSTNYLESPFWWSSSYAFPSYGPWGYTSLCWFPHYGYGYGFGYGYGYGWGPSFYSSWWPAYYGHAHSHFFSHHWAGHSHHGHGSGGGFSGHHSASAIARPSRANWTASRSGTGHRGAGSWSAGSSGARSWGSGSWGSGSTASSRFSSRSGAARSGGSTGSFDAATSRRFGRGGGSFSSGRDAAVVGGAQGSQSPGRWRWSSQGTGASQRFQTDRAWRGWNGGGAGFGWRNAAQGGSAPRSVSRSFTAPSSSNVGTHRWSGGGQHHSTSSGGGRGGGGHRGRR